jgi:hypothetical protein
MTTRSSLAATIFVCSSLMVSEARATPAGDAAILIRKATRAAAAALDSIDLRTLPLGYNQGTSLVQRMADARNHIKSSEQYTSAVERQLTVSDLYLLSRAITDLADELEAIRRSLLSLETTNIREYERIAKLTSKVIEAQGDAVEASTEVFLLAVEYYKTVDRRLEACTEADDNG